METPLETLLLNVLKAAACAAIIAAAVATPVQISQSGTAEILTYKTPS